MRQLDTATRVRVVSALVEGCSIRSTCGMTGVAKGTVLKLLADLGAACFAYHDAHVRGLTSQRLQCDEIWSFCGAKDRNVPPDEQRVGLGSVWTWTAIDADTKLIAAYHVGTRDAGCAYEFMTHLASRVTTRVQLTTDGRKAYINAVADAFGPANIDYAILLKLFGETPAGPERYSPPACIGIEMRPIMGAPDKDHVSTSYVGRQNLRMGIGMRRFTRLTNAFSTKCRNLMYAVALHFMHYNFCRVHQTLAVTPAMQAEIADHVWDLAELVTLIPKPVAKPWGSVKRAQAASVT